MPGLISALFQFLIASKSAFALASIQALSVCSADLDKGALVSEIILLGVFCCEGGDKARLFMIMNGDAFELRCKKGR